MENLIYNHKPVIIGASISGMGISKKLSLNQIEHVLIGDPVKEKRPILGESVEMLGCKILKEIFPDQAQHYYPKLGINYHLEKNICHFDFKRCFKIPEIVELMERTKYTHTAEKSFSLIHVDRALFDASIYEEVINSPYCHHISARVSGLDHDIEKENILQINLTNGINIVPSYVYDGSNALKVLVQLQNLEIEYLTESMRIVFTHYQANENTRAKLNSKENPWYTFTNIMRHYKHISGFEGSSWCIPVGEHISIGTNIIGNCDLTDEEILNVAKQRYQERGINYGNLYPQLVSVTSFKGPLYYSKKTFGNNWVLASGAAALTWYTAQTGVESAMFVSNIADKLLRYPQEYGKYYQEFITQQVNMHRVHDWLHYHSAESVNEVNSHEFMINAIRNIQGRYLLGLLSLDHGLLDKYEWLMDIKKYQAKLSDMEMCEIINSVKRGETCAEYLQLN